MPKQINMSTEENQNLLAENLLYNHKISQLQREIEIYKTQLAKNITKIRDNCDHKWTKEYTCEPCGPTQYSCLKCGRAKSYYYIHNSY